MLRLFGETSDSNASFAAAHGDRASESPLRDLALRSTRPHVKPYLAADVATAVSAEDRFALRDPISDNSERHLRRRGVGAVRCGRRASLRFPAPSSRPSDVVTLIADRALDGGVSAVVPQSAISPAPGTLAVSPPGLQASESLLRPTQIGSRCSSKGMPTGRFGSTPPVSASTTLRTAPARTSTCAPASEASTSISRALTSTSEATTPTRSPSHRSTRPRRGSCPGSGTPFVVPNYADLNRLSLGAGVSVPVMRGLTLNLNYDAQRLYGGYGLPGLMNLDAVNNSYGGKLTFQHPADLQLALARRVSRAFQDNILPINGSTQTREDVNFTVKF